MGMSIGELFVQLGVKADTFTVKDFARAVGNLPFSIASAIAALTGMEVGFMGLTGMALDMANGLNLFSAETGLSTDELQRWQQAADKVGISGNAVTASIKGIQNAVVQATRYGAEGPAMAFGRLGITGIREKTPFEILREMQSRYKAMGPGEFGAAARGLGVSDEMMKLFARGDLNRLLAAKPAMGPGDLKALAEFQAELAAFTLEVKTDFVPILRQLTPVMGDLAKAMGWFIKEFGGFAVSEIKGAKVLLTDPAQYGSNLATVFGWLVDELKRLTPNQVSVAVTQNLIGGDAATHRQGGESLARELPRVVKQLSKER